MLARVDEVRPDAVTLTPFPGVGSRLLADEVTGNDLDDLTELIGVGEVVTAHYVGAESASSWRLRLADVDDDEAVVPLPRALGDRPARGPRRGHLGQRGLWPRRGQLGINVDTLRGWVRQTRIDSGAVPGQRSDDRAKIRELEKEVRELRRTNAIFKSASAYVGDRRQAGVSSRRWSRVS